ncbi:MAG: [protein-PII] uridylyltransferase, partial [Rhodospirillaceae bacterium]|nr:[protein-PII] uridylyltransferase [Rhodospirillaceae bacterium]
FVETSLFPVADKTGQDNLCLVAVGGYGRMEMAPFSDVDLLFLLPPKRSKRSDKVLEAVLYVLWDLGLKVGHATRTADECLAEARKDQTIRTTLLESRYLCGEKKLYREFRTRFQREIATGTATEFIDAKLAERNQRHQRLGDTRYVLEPNIKEGKGGLRDLQTLFWIAKYVHRVDDVEGLVAKGMLRAREVQIFEKARNFLLTLRCHLHYVAGRAEERLTFDVQAEIGRRMGYTDHAGSHGVERFMKHYFLVAKDVGDLTRIFCAALEADRKNPPRLNWRRFSLRKHLPEGFGVEGAWLTVSSSKFFTDDPVNLIRLFELAERFKLDIHPHALRKVTRSLARIDSALRKNKEANRLFVEILTSRKTPEIALTRMNEAGVLGRFIPDFGRVVAQMQHDMYHVYTVDEHTIRAIGILGRIERGDLETDHPLSSEVVGKLVSRRVLYVAVLLHDIAKGRGGDHSILGAEVAMKLCPLLGLDGAESETVAWLVRHHLLMSHTAFRRDLSDPMTVEDFASVVQSPERLRLLLVLTVVDIRAVGPTVWNGWKAALLRELYYIAEEKLTGGVTEQHREARIERAKTDMRARLKAWTKKDVAQIEALGYPVYWLSLDTDTHVRHAGIMRLALADDAQVSVDAEVDKERDVTEVTIYTADHPGLFSKIAGAIALAGGNILDARIFTMTNGMALDSFSVQEIGDWAREEGGHAMTDKGKLKALKKHIEKALTGEGHLEKALAARPHTLPGRTRAFSVPHRVLIENSFSKTHTVIEINGRDRPGLLFDLTKAMTQLGLQISSAKISTYGERVVDVFYVKDVFGLKIESESKLKNIHDAVLEVIPLALGEPADTAEYNYASETVEPASKVTRRRKQSSAARAARKAKKT